MLTNQLFVIFTLSLYIPTIISSANADTIHKTYTKAFSFRKYAHVKHFYKDVTPLAIEVGLHYKVPPAALLAIAGLESGYGRGYVAQITGNILSLGAGKSDKELPRLYLPYSKSKKKILYDEKIIIKLPKSDLIFKLRAQSYKKDYRPASCAGTKYKLNYFKYHKQARLLAYKRCMENFAQQWIVKNSKYKAFREAREYLNKEVADQGTEVLFSERVNENFIKLIGGRKHSFNYRKEWPLKAIMVLNKTGLVPLVKNIYYNKKNFNEVWSNTNE